MPDNPFRQLIHFILCQSYFRINVHDEPEIFLIRFFYMVQVNDIAAVCSEEGPLPAFFIYIPAMRCKMD